MGIELVAGAVVARRYRLDRLIGEGGMGAVWAATHVVTRRAVAMKFVRGPVHLKPDLRRRFLREARAASAVNHPNVVQIHDVFELDDDTPVMVMDLLAGETLASRANRERKLSLEDAAAVLLPVVSAVGTAHSRGIVHRDLKPENVFLAQTDEGECVVKVLDFGIAKLTIEAGDTDEGPVTGTGTALGTPCYMAPEQCFGEKSIDHRADVWALGVMFYELLAGCRPIEGDSVGHVVKTMMTTSITPLEVLVPSVPEEFSTLVRRMLSRERDGRPNDLREVQALLVRYSLQKVRNFGAPASLPAPSVEREAADRRSSDPALSPRPREPDRAPTTDNTDDDQRGAEPTFVSGELPRITTTGPHSVASVNQPRGRMRIWLLGAAAVLGLIGAIVLSQRPSATPRDEQRATSAGVPQAAPNTEPTPDPGPAMVTSPTATQALTASAPTPAASAPIPLASSPAAAAKRSAARATPGSKTASKPAGTAAPPTKKSGNELFDDRK